MVAPRERLLVSLDAAPYKDRIVDCCKGRALSWEEPGSELWLIAPPPLHFSFRPRYYVFSLVTLCIFMQDKVIEVWEAILQFLV